MSTLLMKDTRIRHLRCVDVVSKNAVLYVLQFLLITRSLFFLGWNSRSERTQIIVGIPVPRIYLWKLERLKWQPSSEIQKRGSMQALSTRTFEFCVIVDWLELIIFSELINQAEASRDTNWLHIVLWITWNPRTSPLYPRADSYLRPTMIPM